MRRRLPTLLSSLTVAVAATTVAVLVRALLTPWMGSSAPFMTLYGAVAIAVWYGGYPAAVVATTLGFVACDYLFRAPAFRFTFAADLPTPALFFLTAGIIIVLGGAMRRAQRRAEAAAERLRVTVESLGDAVVTTDAQGNIAYLNPAAESLVGWTKDEAGGRPLDGVFRTLDEATRKPLANDVSRSVPEGDLVGAAQLGLLVARDGSERPVREHAAAIKDAEGRRIGTVVVFHDEAERRSLQLLERDLQRQLEQRVEERTADLRASEERFRLLVEGTRDYAIYMLDPAGRVASWNRGAERIKQYRADEIVGQHFSRFYPAADVATGKPQRGLEIAAAQGEFADEGWRVRKDGTQFWASVVITALRDEAGGLIGFSKVTRDVTERKQSEERARRLLEEETARRTAERYALEIERQAAIVSSSADAIISKSLGGVIQTWNAAAERIFGYAAEEAIGRHITIIIPPERVAEENEIVARLANGQRVSHFETVRVRRDGERIDVSLTVSPLRDASGKVVGASKIARDISERKRSEERLRENEERLRLATQTGKVGVWEWDVVADRISWTDSLYAIHGVVREGFDATVAGFAALIHPADRPAVETALEQALAGDTAFEIEVRAVRPDGEVIWIFSNAVVLRSEGRPVRMVGATVDVTDRRRAEEALREADRRKDEFLATLAHELRNPLAPISNAVQVLGVTGPTDADLRWGREVINRQVKQMARLLDDLLDVSRISYNKLELRKERIDLAAVIRGAVETSSPLIDAGGHHLEIDLLTEPIWLDGDTVRLAQVFSNLLNNAARYTPPGGHIAIAAAREGDQVVVSVKDDGIGITAEMLPRLFQIFAQAKPALERSQGGLGIGLSLVRGVVELHGGTIEARSEGLERGSEFVVRLPVAERSVSTSALPRDEVKEPVKVLRRILVVDDLVDSADSLTLLLEMMGHEVSTAYDGEQAVARAAELLPEVILLDIGLPKLNGYDVCRQIRQQAWGRSMFLVALTGWGQEDDRRRTTEAGFDHHLVKPIDLATLSRLLASLPQLSEQE